MGFSFSCNDLRDRYHDISRVQNIPKIKNCVDAVENGVKIPEADPESMSVGLGGLPDREGKVTLDACIMDETGNCGSVSFLQHIKHPISVARKIMDETPHVMLAGEGALKLALEKGFPKEDLLTEKAEKRWKEWLRDSKYQPIINIENQKIIFFTHIMCALFFFFLYAATQVE